MKRAIIWLLILTIFIQSVTAGNVYEAEDFTEHPEQLMILECYFFSNLFECVS